ncbi:pseudouridine synthase [Chitinophaga sp. Cy-1792]|uniref:pseudouridine synthase n=1 Tax=Chitinophaga sp. Cy-1792 TaxID=2608339 RepID=UPI00141E1E41|nr:pseudouridine synthase [Chitinophaga sp. Cy-1792]NIG51989.1 pseudouridine synthase [Chitinophaga sp. Cy-1792]
MKKKLPASKGFSPFKENKSGKSEKPAAGNRNRSSFDGERPGRASAKDENTSSFRKRSFDAKDGDAKPERKRFEKNDEGKAPFRKREFNADKPEDKPRFGKRSDRNADEKPAFKRFDRSEKPAFGKRTDRDEKPAFGKRFDKSEKPAFGKRDRDEKPAFGKRFDKSEKPAFGKRDRDEKPAFGKRFDKSEKPAFGKRADRDEKPAFKGGRKSDNYKKDDESSFHGDFKSDKSARETPSGFNRKKFFDRTNDRFADKHERRTDKHERRRKPIQPREESAELQQIRKEAKENKAGGFGPGEMPLNKYIAHSGLCSRRKAVDYIREGKVTVNGMTVTEPATKVTAKDTIVLANKKLSLQKNLVYILLNKPKGYITTTDDPEGRKTVMELIEDAVENERVYPVGRLDRNTSGLLLLTNDGELAQKLAHPSHNIKKIYQVELDKPLTKSDAEKIVAGLTLEDGLATVDALGYLDPKDKKQVGIEIHSGKNRIVRRIFEHLEYSVEKLDRVMYAGLTKKTLNRGQWRFLSEKEVILLKHFK